MEQITLHISEHLTGLTNLLSPDWESTLRTLTSAFQDAPALRHAVAVHEQHVVGRLLCVRNDGDPHLWYLGDLYVCPAFRHRGIASGLIRAAAAHLTDMGATRLRVYIEQDNPISLALHQGLGFREVPWLPFNDLLNQGQRMLEYPLPSRYHAVPAQLQDAWIIANLYAETIRPLHGAPISLAQWQAMLANPDPDEAHFLLCQGVLPVAWVKLNGLLGDEAWLSMLVVSPACQRQGAGRAAVAFAEDFARQRGFPRLHICTTADNLPAQALYARCGYTVAGQECGTYPNGAPGTYLVFVKTL